MVLHFSTIQTYTLGDMVLHYMMDEARHVELMLYPQTEQAYVRLPHQQRTPISLVQAKLAGMPMTRISVTV